MPRAKTGGRQIGTPNKMTTTIRDAFQDAFEHLQKDPKRNLRAWAARNPNEFYKLIARMIPKDEMVMDNSPMVINVVTGIPARMRGIPTNTLVPVEPGSDDDWSDLA